MGNKQRALAWCLSFTLDTWAFQSDGRSYGSGPHHQPSARSGTVVVIFDTRFSHDVGNEGIWCHAGKMANISFHGATGSHKGFVPQAFNLLQRCRALFHNTINGYVAIFSFQQYKHEVHCKQ